MDNKKIKKCSTCKVSKNLLDFNKNKSQKDGYENLCRLCKKNYYDLNKNSILKNKKEYHINNKEKISIIKKEYCKNNRDKINSYYRVYSKKRKLTDHLYKLSCNIRTLIGMSIKGSGYKKKSKINEYLCCSFEEFKKHLELQFKDGMNWKNQGEWHLDHIYPISLAKDEEELIKLNHYTNFQPLWAVDNIKKGNKIL
jgi:hypothetical protein